MTFASIPSGLFERIVNEYSTSRGAPRDTPSRRRRSAKKRKPNIRNIRKAAKLPPGNNAQKDARDIGSFGQSDHKSHTCT